MNAERTVSARWTLCEHWWVHSEREQRDVESASEHTMSARKNGKVELFVSVSWVNRTISFLQWNILSSSRVNSLWDWKNDDTDKPLSLKDNWCHSACLNTTVHNSTVKWQPKNNLHTIAYTFLRIYALLLHTCDTTSFEFPRLDNF